jgi:hypothetical protein
LTEACGAKPQIGLLEHFLGTKVRSEVLLGAKAKQLFPTAGDKVKLKGGF